MTDGPDTQNCEMAPSEERLLQLKRLAAFLRSVIPADPFQVLFLLGAVFLYVSPRLSWVPVKVLFESPESLFDLSKNPDGINALRAQMLVALWPLIFSGLAAYFLCFWSGRRPLRRIVLAVLVPGFGALVTMVGLVAYYTAPYQSVLAAGSGLHKYGRLLPLLSKFPTGFHFSVVALILISVFAARVGLGMSELPLTLLAATTIGRQESTWQRTKILVYLLLGPFFLMSAVVFFPLTLFSISSPVLFSTISKIGSFLDGSLLLAISLLVVGASGRGLARRVIRLPEPKFALVGLAIACGIDCLIPAVWYLFDRMQWAAHNVGWFDPPRLSAYFDSVDPWLLLLIFAAFAEEVVFRGILQPRFIQRFGIQRGMFLTTIVWAAIHFRSDSYSGASDGGILLQLGLRIGMCAALGYVFAWLTLRSGSVIPSSICHAAHNMLVISQTAHRFPASGAVLIALWGICAYILFRYWPVSDEGIPSAEVGSASLEAAT